MFVLVSTVWVMICSANDNPANCEICAVICFLHIKCMSTLGIHYETCVIYGQNVTREGTIRQSWRLFKDGWTDVNNEEQSGWSFAVGDDLVQNVDQEICERHCFTILNFCENFHKSCCFLQY
jgi:hypothetical protein